MQGKGLSMVCLPGLDAPFFKIETGSLYSLLTSHYSFSETELVSQAL